ncbi:MAG: HAD-IC family P-type ATPase [Candidatus Niyogibacteria bacterium]|nr:HAD-IC family P-type ATPase [Candidatus Niyogibacteria bacterium]
MENNLWHAKNPKEIAAQFHSDLKNGLSFEQYKNFLKLYGPNTIEKKKRFWLADLLWHQIKSPLVFILIFAGIVAIMLREWSDAAVIGITLIINTAVGALQEGRADKAFDKLKDLVRRRSIVMREGKEMEVDSETLVPGDIIIVRAGDRAGADARIIESKTLSANESELTGEWMPSEKHANMVAETMRITERTNMLWMGTTMTEGWGKAIVVNTAKYTELGKIAASLEETEALPAPFQKGIKRLAHYIAAIIVVASIIIFAVGTMKGQNISQMFLVAVAISVAAIPEGLPIATTVILAIGMGRVLKRGGLIRSLAATETLGSTSIILTDKTGTLTRAEMEVSDIITPEEILRSKRPEENELLPSKLYALEIGILSADAFIENPEAELKNWIIRGKPTETALLRAGIHAGLHPAEIIKRDPRLDFLPFDAERRLAASLNKIEKGSQLSAAGAPEKILNICARVKIGNKIFQLSGKMREQLVHAYQKATGGGSRVLGLAYKTNHWKAMFGKTDKTDAGEDLLGGDFIFVGFVLLHDPLRKDAKYAINEAGKAGLRPIMMTGDHPATAFAVAEQVGLIDTDNRHDAKDDRIMDGERLEKMNSDDLEKIIDKIDVYARVLPHQKLKIVEAWQRRGEVVAMTGDGVNDAPALKRADIGIALGSGTDVAKEAADLVLLSNSFSVIIAAIEGGRVIVDNLRKVVTFLLSTGFTEIILIGGALMVGLPLPVLPAQILWANLIEEGFMNFAFAFEPKEDDVMERDPRAHSSRKILTREMMWIIFGIGMITNFFLFILFTALIYLEYPIQEIRTMMFAGLVIDAIFFVYPLKNLHEPLWKINLFSNPYLLIANAASIILLALALTFPPLQRLLSLVPITMGELSVILGLGVLDLIALETAKFYFITKEEKRLKIV